MRTSLAVGIITSDQRAVGMKPLSERDENLDENKPATRRNLNRRNEATL